MNMIESNVFIINERDPYKKIELAGRTCYKSEDKITEDSAVAFVTKMYKSGHFAMLEHAVFWFYVECENTGYLNILANKLSVFPYCNLTFEPNRVIFSGNARALLENNLANFVDGKFDFSVLEEEYGLHQCYFEDLENKTDMEILYHRYTTMRFICDRGVSHELVRHRPFSFAQESTRYVKYDTKMQIIKPSDFDSWDFDSQTCFMSTVNMIELSYRYLIEKGRTAQQARSILQNLLKTEVVVTGNDKEWKHFFSLRCSKAAHPDMQRVAYIAKSIYIDEYNLAEGAI